MGRGCVLLMVTVGSPMCAAMWSFPGLFLFLVGMFLVLRVPRSGVATPPCMPGWRCLHKAHVEGAVVGGSGGRAVLARRCTLSLTLAGLTLYVVVLSLIYQGRGYAKTLTLEVAARQNPFLKRYAPRWPLTEESHILFVHSIHGGSSLADAIRTSVCTALTHRVSRVAQCNFSTRRVVGSASIQIAYNFTCVPICVRCGRHGDLARAS